MQPNILELLNDPTVPTWVSSNDALGQVYPTEHSGRVRGLGFGATPTKVHIVYYDLDWFQFI